MWLIGLVGHAASKVGDDKAALERQELEVMTRTAQAAVQVLSRLESTRAVCDCMAAIMSGDLIPKPKGGGAAGGSPQPLTPSERLLPLSHPRASPGSQSPEWVADLLVAVLQRAGQSSFPQTALQPTCANDIFTVVSTLDSLETCLVVHNATEFSQPMLRSVCGLIPCRCIVAQNVTLLPAAATSTAL